MKEGRKPLSLFLNYDFNRIFSIEKENARHQRLVEGDSFVSNTKIHSIHNK